jgi:hypothetical protein
MAGFRTNIIDARGRADSMDVIVTLCDMNGTIVSLSPSKAFTYLASCGSESS